MCEPSVYVRWKGDQVEMIVVYVDDLGVATSSERRAKEIFEQMEKYITIGSREEALEGKKIRHLGCMIEKKKENGVNYFTLSLVKNKVDALVQAVLKTQDLEPAPVQTPALPKGKKEDTVLLNEKRTTIYRTGVGMILYMSKIRPDLVFAAAKLSQKNEPTRYDMEALVKTARYIWTTMNHEVELKFDPNRTYIESYTDAISTLT